MHYRFGRTSIACSLLLATLAALPANAQDATPPATQQTTQDTAPKTLPPKVKEDVEAITAQLLQVRGEPVELSCPKAVENARYGIETMLEVGQRNRDGGYLSAADYERMAGPIKQELDRLSLADCEAAQGGRQDFYRCMSNDYNHVLACAKLDK